MPDRRYEDFDLIIEGTGETGYRARVIDSPAGQASNDFAAPFNQLELENFLLRIGRPRRGVRRLESPELEAAREFGSKLFDAVFAGQVGDALRRSIDDSDREGAGLRIRLRLSDAPELGNVPWEYLFSSTNDRFLVLSAWTPIVRYLDLPVGTTPLAVASPLRILVVISSPTDFPPLAVDNEWARLSESVSDLQNRGLVVMDKLEDATLLTLQRQLRRENYHILHFVGHGGFDERADDGVLMFEDESGRAKLVTGRDLGTILHDHRSLRLAVLNACEGARTATDDPFAGSAQNLVRQGIPAVVAMQFEITDGAAITFAHELYQAVSEGFPIDAALAEARRAIFGSGNDIEWGTPVLYMRTQDGLIFDVDKTGAVTRPPESMPTKPADEAPLDLPLTAPVYRGVTEDGTKPTSGDSPHTARPQAVAADSPPMEDTKPDVSAPPPVDDTKPAVPSIPPREPAKPDVPPPVDDSKPAVPSLPPLERAKPDVSLSDRTTSRPTPPPVVDPVDDGDRQDSEETETTKSGLIGWMQKAGMSEGIAYITLALVSVAVIIGAFVFAGNGDDLAAPTTTVAGNDTVTTTSLGATTTTGDRIVPPPTDGDALVVHLAARPSIDGVGTEYARATAHPTPYTIFTASTVASGGVTRLGTAATSLIQLGWDDRGLYIFGIVVDDVLSQPNTGNQIWHGDAINLNLAFSGVGLAASERPAGNDFQLTLSPGDSAAGTQPGSVLFIGNGQGFGDNFTAVAEVASIETDDGYTLEAFVPWTTFGLADPPAMTIGGILTVFDNDGEMGTVNGVAGTLQTVILSNTEEAGFQRPQEWGLLRFTD